MLVDNQLTSPVRTGTLLGVGMTRHAYVHTTQIAKFVQIQKLRKHKKKNVKVEFQNKDEGEQILVSCIRKSKNC